MCSSTYRRCWVSSTRSSRSVDRLAPAFVLAVFRPFLSRPQRMTHARSLALPLCTSMNLDAPHSFFITTSFLRLVSYNTPLSFLVYSQSEYPALLSLSLYLFGPVLVESRGARTRGLCTTTAFRLSILCVSRPSVSLSLCLYSAVVLLYPIGFLALFLPSLSLCPAPRCPQDMYQWYLMYARLSGP